jgi:hypothetical protein
MTIFVFDFDKGEWVDGGEDAKYIFMESIAMMLADHADKK